MTTTDESARRPVGGGLIDVHHHFNPGGKDNEGKLWSVDMALDAMDASGIAAAVASLGPVNDVGSDGRNARIRASNEWGARACGDHPGRFGLFASLPLPDVDLALAEIAYAYDVLRVDGIGLSTSEGDTWLSDERYAPVLAELDRRKAVVFVHPAPTSLCRALGHAYGGDMIAPAWLEFPVNTARLILGFLVKGVTRTCPGIRFIFAHGGGLAPLLLGRVTGFSGWQTVGPRGSKGCSRKASTRSSQNSTSNVGRPAHRKPLPFSSGSCRRRTSCSEAISPTSRWPTASPNSTPSGSTT